MPARESIAVSLAAIPLLIGAGYIVYEFGPLILYAVGKDPTLTQRTIIWAAAWGAAKQNLMLGYGYAAFWTGTQGPAHTITLVAGWALQQSQNGYLDVWLQLGVVGVGIVAIMLLKSVRDVTRCFRGSRDPGYVRWCMVVLICIVVQNVGESSLCFARLSWLMFLLAFAGLSQAARAGRRVDTPLPRPDLLEREVSERGIPELEVFETVVLETRGRLSYAEPAALE
jgi:O-antigen ligase